MPVGTVFYAPLPGTAAVLPYKTETDDRQKAIVNADNTH